MARRQDPLWVASWKNYDIGRPSTAGVEELRSAVRRAAKTANQRLLRLERAGFTKTAYRMAMHDLNGRHRYYERTEKLSLAELRHEYAILRDFISAKTSTVQGQNQTNYKRYLTAVDKGYTGTEDEFYELIDKYYTEAVESMYDSNIVYEAILTDSTDIIDRVMESQRGETNRGRALLSYLRERRRREGT